MPGKRKFVAPGLPRRVDARRNKAGEITSYRYKHPDGSYVYLGREINAALKRHSEIADGPMTANARDVWSAARKRAKTRRLAFTLTPEDVQSILDAQGGRCAVTGLSFANKKVEGVRIRPWMPSLDRIDNAKGYFLSNVRVVCAGVNIAMNQLGEALFLELARAMMKPRKSPDPRLMVPKRSEE